ncbi:hypothetical protein EBR78_01020 [bacterium]|nr:hypothetical protein [bacterium]
MVFVSNVTNSVRQGCRKRAIVFLCLFQAGTLFGTNSQKLEIIKKIPHSGYSEGLDFHAGFLWHALPKAILKIDPRDGTVLEQFTPASEYSESIKWFRGELYNLSFSNDGLYRGRLNNKQLQFKKIASLPEPHGWGIESIEGQLVVTGNFSNKLHFFDLKKEKWVRSLETDANELEDLAWDGKRLWTSSFSTHRGSIFSIDLKTGKMSGMWELPEKDQCPVIDGIAFDGKSLWITGKECPSIYQVKIPATRVLSSPSEKKK